MTIKSHDLAKNTNLEEPEIKIFNALVQFFNSEAMQVSEPCTLSGCYGRDAVEDDEYEWQVVDSHTYIGSLCFGRKHQYSVKKFYWTPNDDLEDYFFALTECVPEEMRSLLWTEQEARTSLHSTSDARSDYSTY